MTAAGFKDVCVARIFPIGNGGHQSTVVVHP